MAAIDFIPKPIPSFKVSLRPEEQISVGGLINETIPDIEGTVIEFLQGDPLDKEFFHGLELPPEGLLVIKKEGFTDIFFDNVTTETVTLHRSADETVKVILF